MTTIIQQPLQEFDENTAIRAILEGTAGATGELFFRSLVKNLCSALHTHGAWVTEYLTDSRRLRAFAFWLGDHYVDEYEYDIAGTPCEPVIDDHCLIHIPKNVINLFPRDPDLTAIGAVSYLGIPLEATDGTILGHLAVLDIRPMPDNPRTISLFKIFAARAAAELQRIHAEEEIRQREVKLTNIINSAMDAIIEFDANRIITHCNPATERIFHCKFVDLYGRSFEKYFTEESNEKIVSLMKNLDMHRKTTQHMWIAGGLNACCYDGDHFTAEATISRYMIEGNSYFSLILRNVNDRIEAEQRIQSLTSETEYLREEIKAIHNFDEIIGRSEPMLHALRDVAQVAPTDSTVLISGETGTGKELFARAIHAESKRSDKPFIKVNCAAIPASLIESELFGHEKGAFTGATTKREGRFTLAHKGTLFLDEIGELPVELQVKLLRVLQEGEFEPVGSSHTCKVDVRIIAATNKDLYTEVKENKFREDLYYRLHVYPINVPPLRERGDDIALLAGSFVKKYSRKFGKKINPLSLEIFSKLKAYRWPGNVRELQNIIERGVIKSNNGTLQLDIPISTVSRPKIIRESSDDEILTVQALEDLERTNILRALEKSGWKIAGRDGAAAILAMPPTTLSSRIKVLGLKRK